jgi:hypothetical protein
LRNFSFIASTIGEREESRLYIYLPSHDKPFEKKNIEKDDIEKK